MDHLVIASASGFAQAAAPTAMAPADHDGAETALARGTGAAAPPDGAERAQMQGLKPSRPLHFSRLLLHPLDPLIVPHATWRNNEPTLPRHGLIRIAQHVRQALGSDAVFIEDAIAGRTTGDTDLLARMGRVVWPAAARMIADDAAAGSPWLRELGQHAFRPVAEATAILLAEAATLDTLINETAHGLLPPRPESISVVANRIVGSNRMALPMFMTLLLARLPQAAAFVPELLPARHAALMRGAAEQALRLLLHRLDDDNRMNAQIDAGPLRQAGSAARRIATLLDQCGGWLDPRQRLARMRSVRSRLHAACVARFSRELRENLLQPLERGSQPLDAAAIASLEVTARGLRMLQAAGRTAGGTAEYDRLLRPAADFIASATLRDRLGTVGQIRLVEILGGSEPALLMLRAAG